MPTPVTCAASGQPMAGRVMAAGMLLPYEPAGYSRVHPAFKDRDGAWTGIFVDAFSAIYNVDSVGAKPPATATDLLDPRWKGRIVSTYPNDDDAVLYLYKLMVDKYGWDWLRRFLAQDVAWVRGTQEPADRVEAGTRRRRTGHRRPAHSRCRRENQFRLAGT